MKPVHWCAGKVNNWSRNNRGRCAVRSQLHTAQEAKGGGRWQPSSYHFIFNLQEKTEPCWDTISTVLDMMMMMFVNQTENTMISYRHNRLWNVFDSQWLSSKTVLKTNILCRLSFSFCVTLLSAGADHFFRCHWPAQVTLYFQTGRSLIFRTDGTPVPPLRANLWSRVLRLRNH